MATIKTPVKDFTGVVVGVHFKDGEGETADTAAIQYFERHGYTVEPGEALAQPSKSASKADWEAYALQEGHEVDGLTAEQIKALFIAPETPQGDNSGEGGDPAKTEQ